MSNKDEIANMYPIYHDGSILKSEDLNQSFDFLHSQLKSTRNLLFGQGIVSGLTCSYRAIAELETESSKEETITAEGTQVESDDLKSAAEITINSGVAVTRSGAIVKLSADKIYDRCVLVSDFPKNGYSTPFPEGAEYVLIEKDCKDNLNGLKNIDTLIGENCIENFLLAIQVAEKKEGEQEYCSFDTCNYSADKVVLEFVPILIRKQKKETSADQGEQMSDLLYMNPIDVKAQRWADYNILPVFLRQAANHFYDKVVAVANCMSKMTAVMGTLQSKYFMFNVAKIKEQPDALIFQLGEMDFDNQRVATYLSFANDLVEAANELVAQYNQFCEKYRLTEAQQGNNFEDAIVLGTLSQTKESHTDRSEYQTYYQDSGRNQDEYVLVRMYNRVLMMIESFSPKQVANVEDVVFIPEVANLPLGERWLPMYYETEQSGLVECWDAHHPYHVAQTKVENQGGIEGIVVEKELSEIEEMTSVESSESIRQEPKAVEKQQIGKRTSFTVGEYNSADRFRLEGYENLPVRILKKKLLEIIRENNLPIIVLEHELEGDESSYILESFNPKDEEQTFIDAETAELDTNLIQKMVEQVVQYEKLTYCDSIFNKEGSDERQSVRDALNVIIEYSAAQDVVSACAALDKLSESEIEEIRQSIYILVKGKSLPIIVKRRLEFILLVIFYHYNPNMLKSCSHPGADYVSGVERKDVLLMMTQNNQVLACLNMPSACLSICGEKYKDQLSDYHAFEDDGHINSILGFEKLDQITNYSRDYAIETATHYDMYMFNYGPNKDVTAHHLVAIKDGLKLKDATALASNTPSLIFENILLSTAEDIAFTLNGEFGACLVIVPVGKFKAKNNVLTSIENCDHADIRVTLFDQAPEDAMSDISRRFGAGCKMVVEENTRVINMKCIDTSIFLEKPNSHWKKFDAVLEIKPIKDFQK